MCAQSRVPDLITQAFKGVPPEPPVQHFAGYPRHLCQHGHVATVVGQKAISGFTSMISRSQKIIHAFKRKSILRLHRPRLYILHDVIGNPGRSPIKIFRVGLSFSSSVNPAGKRFFFMIPSPDIVKKPGCVLPLYISRDLLFSNIIAVRA